MSVKVHEAFCLDSHQDRLLFGDDFLGDSLRDLWAISGSVVVVDAQDGGIIRITTGAVEGNNASADWNDIRSLLVSNKVTFEIRLKLNHTAGILTFMGMYEDISDNIAFRFDTDTDTNWMIVSEDGGAVTDEDSGITPDTDYHIFRIECLPTGEIHYYIDGVETSNSPITTNIPTEYLQPWLFVWARADSAVSVDIDYVAIRQEI